MGMSFEEKCVWIQLVAMGVVMGGYFVVAASMLSGGEDTLGAFVPLLIVATALMVVVLGVGHAAAAILRRPEPRDERDRLIGWRAEARASWVVSAGVIVGIGCMAVSVGVVWVANLLLLSMFLSEMLKYVLQIVSYRRGL